MSVNDNTEKHKAIEKIEKWLKEEGLTIEVVNNPTAYYFGIVKLYDKEKNGQETNKPDFDVIHVNIPRDFHDRILIENCVGFGGLDLKAFEKLPPDKQHAFIHDLKLALYQLNVLFSFQGMTKVRISKVIIFDGLSKHILFDTIAAVLSANRVTNVKYGQLSDSLFSGTRRS